MREEIAGEGRGWGEGGGKAERRDVGGSWQGLACGGGCGWSGEEWMQGWEKEVVGWKS
jgi:hypothetical protein